MFSGSAVVVSGDISKRITGTKKEAIIAIYTGTKVGTCLAWSVDSDQTNTTASKFVFQVNNKTIAYQIKSQTLLDEELKPDSSNRIKMRMLVDWGQLEISWVSTSLIFFLYIARITESPMRISIDKRSDLYR